MPTTVSREGGEVTLLHEGELTIYTAAEFKTNLVAALAGCRDLDLDLAGVSEIDTAGLQLLLAAERAVVGKGGAMHLAGCSEAVRDLLDLCNLTGRFGDAGAP